MKKSLSTAGRSSRASMVATGVALSLGVAAGAASATTFPVVATPSSSLSAFWANGSRGTVTVGSDGHLHQLAVDSAGNWTQSDLSAGAGAPAVQPLTSTTLQQQVDYYVGNDGHIRSIKAGVVTDITAATNAPLAMPRAKLSSIYKNSAVVTAPTYEPRIYYVATNGHVIVLIDHGAPLGVEVLDTTAYAGANAVLADPQSNLTSMAVNLSGAWYDRIYYQAANGHVMEIAEFYNPSYGWSNTDVTAQAGGVTGAPGTQLTSFALGTYKPRVYYFDYNGHVQELAWESGWHAGDITSRTGAPPATNGPSLTSYDIDSNSFRIYFTSNEGHVRQLSWSGGWSTTDLSSGTAAPAAVAGSALSAVSIGNGQEAVYYISADSHVQQFTWSNGWHSFDVNTGTSPVIGVGGGGGCNNLNLQRQATGQAPQQIVKCIPR